MATKHTGTYVRRKKKIGINQPTLSKISTFLLIFYYGYLPFSSSIRFCIIPAPAISLAHASSLHTVPINMITSNIKSSSAEPASTRWICL